MGPGGMAGPAFPPCLCPEGCDYRPGLFSQSERSAQGRGHDCGQLPGELKRSSAVVADTDSVIQRLSSDRSVRSQKDSAEMARVAGSLFLRLHHLHDSVHRRQRTHPQAGPDACAGHEPHADCPADCGEGLFLCIPALLGGLAAGFCLVYLLEEGSSSMPP